MESIKGFTVSNVGHGNRQIVELENNNFIIYDLGNGDYLLDNFAEEHPDSHVTIIISHTHDDHIGGIDNVLELHKEGKLTVDTVYMNLSILKSEALSKILETDSNIEIKDFSDNKEELQEILGYLFLSNGDKKQISTFIKEFNIGKSKEEKICFDEVKSFADIEKAKIAKEYQEEFDKVLSEKDIDEKTKKKVNKLFENIRKLKNTGVEVKSAPTNEVVSIYGIYVEFYQLDRERFKTALRKAKESPEIAKLLGFIEKGNKHYKKLEKIGDKEGLEYLDKIIDFYREEVKTYILNEFYVKVKDKERLDEANIIANYLVRRVFSSEENMNNIACRVFDDKHSFFLSGDMEMPLEMQIMIDGREVACDVYIMAHHSSFTSNNSLFLTEMILQSLEKGKLPIIISTNSEKDNKKYKELNEKKFDLLECIHLKTVDGTISFEIDGDKLYIKQESITNMLYPLQNEVLKKLIKSENLTYEEKVVLEKMDELYERWTEKGFTLDDFSEIVKIKALEKLRPSLPYNKQRNILSNENNYLKKEILNQVEKINEEIDNLKEIDITYEKEYDKFKEENIKERFI